MRRAWWPGALALVGILVVLALGAHAAGAYQTIASSDVAANVHTPNPYALFDDLTTNGVRVPNGVAQADRQRYNQALEQLVLDGTGVCLGVLLLLVAGYAAATL